MKEKPQHTLHGVGIKIKDIVYHLRSGEDQYNQVHVLKVMFQWKKVGSK